MSYKVYFSIVLEEELKKGDWNPKTTKSEYTRGYRFDNDVDAIKLYSELRDFGHNQYFTGVINNEKYFGIITTSRGGFNIVIYIEKWEGFDNNITKDIEHNGFHCSSEDELIEKLIEEKGLSDEELIKHNMPLFGWYLSDGWFFYGYGPKEYFATSIYKYKDIVIFGTEPLPIHNNNKADDDDIPF